MEKHLTEVKLEYYKENKPGAEKVHKEREEKNEGKLSERDRQRKTGGQGWWVPARPDQAQLVSVWRVP